LLYNILEFIFGALNIIIIGGYSSHTPVASDSERAREFSRNIIEGFSKD
jgi:hypothetical protein